MSVRCKKWIICQKFDGKPSADNFKLVEEDIDDNLEDGDILVEAEFLSVDPYMRITKGSFEARFQGDLKTKAFGGEQVGKVSKSKSKLYPVGCHVIGDLGWRTHTVCHESKVRALPELGELPLSAAFGVLGMPGITAYFGVLDILKIQPGDVCFISSAAGAVGSVAGQICKLKGCTVIGAAGSQEKLDWLKDLGFDYVFNYKSEILADALKKYAPNGIDCYFDNVGGDFTSTVIGHMKQGGRIAVCGSISTFHNDNDQPKGPYPFYDILLKRLRIQGYLVLDYFAQWPTVQKVMLPWIQQGKVKYREHVTYGFDNMPAAFLGLFTGSNFGKAVVKV